MLLSHPRCFLSQIRRLAVAILLVPLTACALSKRQPDRNIITIPEGWYLSLTNIETDLLQAKEDKPSYRLDFDRTGASSADRYFIRIAEAIFPERSLILAAAPRPQNGKPRLDSWYFERLWWSETFRGYRLPFSLTGDTVKFYLARYQHFKSVIKQQQENNPWQSSQQYRLQFAYSATVIREYPDGDPSISSADDDLRPVRVLLKLRWYEFCGQSCGWGFEKTREVHFIGRKTVTAIRGDGPADRWVSSDRSPYAPGQWVTF